MKVNNFFKIFLIIFIITFIFISTFNISYGYSLNISDFRTYSYSLVTNDDELNSLVTQMKSSDNYYGGNYYYFAWYSYNNWKYVGCLVPKSNFEGSASLSSLTNANGYYQANLILSSTNIKSNLIRYGFSGNAIDAYVNDYGFTVGINNVDYDNRVCNVLFATDYPFDITYPDVNGNTLYFLHNSPYIADDDYTISNLNGSYFLIYPNNPSITNFHFSLCQTELVEGDLPYEKETVLIDFLLDSSSPYYNCPLGNEVWFEIPYDDFLGITIKKGEEYNWRLQYDLYGNTYYIDRYVTSLVDFTFDDGGSSSGDNENEGNSFENVINDSTSAIIDSNKETQNAINNQTQAIQENTETNKSIWETLKEVLSYINPFSENFFVYKLIDLLIDGLKSLFIPSSDFFSTYFEDLRDWFSDRLGFLWTPFDVIIEILEDISSINFSEPIISVPDIYEPFTNTKLISAFSYNLNSLLDNSIFNTVHNIYLVCVDAIIIFAMIHLTHKKIEEVFSN